MTTATAHKDRYQIRDEARIEFDNANPLPEQIIYSLKDADHVPTPISRHSEGRVWFELGEANYPSSTTTIYMFITIGETVHKLAIKESELIRLNLSIFEVKTKAEWIDGEKATYQAQYKEWQQALTAHNERRAAFVEEAENKWRASLPAKPPTDDDDDDDDDDQDYDDQEYEDGTDDDE